MIESTVKESQMSADREWYGNLARDLVTRGEWKAFCEETGRKDESLRQEDPDDAPVVGITWFEAKAFAEHHGCRLPTEQELKDAEGMMKGWIDAETDWEQWPLERPEAGKVGATAPIRDLWGVVYQWCEDEA
jgi:formylglycine-generating enzyme required for sulfatase activity